MKKLWRNILRSWGIIPRWHVITWPYHSGYGTAVYHRGKKTIVDSGLSWEEAEQIVREGNY